MSPSTPRRRRLFAHIGSRTAARLALCAPAGWLVKTKLLLPVGEAIDLCLRFHHDTQAALVPAMVVGRRPGEGILVRCRAEDLAALQPVEEPPPPVTAMVHSVAELEDVLVRMLCGEQVRLEVFARGEVFLRLCVGGEPRARIAFPAVLLDGDRPTRVKVRLDDPAARQAVKHVLQMSAGRSAVAW